MKHNSTLLGRITEQLAEAEREVNAALAAKQVIEELGLNDMGGSVCIYTRCYDKLPLVTLSLYGANDIKTLAESLVHTVGKFKKGFNDRSGDIELKFEYLGVEVTISGPPPGTCSVRQVKTQKWVPEYKVAAHSETVTKFEMVGDCLPLTQKETPFNDLEWTDGKPDGEQAA